MGISSNPIMFIAVFFAAFMIAAGMLLLVGMGISRCCSKTPSFLEQKELSQELGEHWIMGQRQSIVFTPLNDPPPYSARSCDPSPDITDAVDTIAIRDSLTAISLDNAAQIAASNHVCGSPTSFTGHTAHHLTLPPPAVVGVPFTDVTAMDRSWRHRLIV